MDHPPAHRGQSNVDSVFQHLQGVTQHGAGDHQATPVHSLYQCCRHSPYSSRASTQPNCPLVPPTCTCQQLDVVEAGCGTPRQIIPSGISPNRGIDGAHPLPSDATSTQLVGVCLSHVAGTQPSRLFDLHGICADHLRSFANVFLVAV